MGSGPRVKPGRPLGPSNIPEAELELVDRARARDTAAFEELVDRHRDHVYGLAFRIVRSAPDAEEVAQDAFVRAWRALPGFRGEAAFGTWLHRIAVRLAVDRASVLSSRARREAAVEPVALAAVEGPGADSLRWQARRLEGLMANLSQVQRAALTLYYLEDRSVDEVARVLAMPVNTVKTHLSRGRAALRRVWMTAEQPAGGEP